MTLSECLAENVRACFSGIWIPSCEYEDAMLEIARLCRDEDWKLASWDVDRGLRSPQAESSSEMAGADPLGVVRSLGEMPVEGTPTLLVLVNFHRFLNSAEIVQAMAHQIVQGKVLF